MLVLTQHGQEVWRMKPFSPEVSPDPPRATAAHLLYVCTLFLTLLNLAQGSRASMVPNKPFITVWNADTHWCLESYGVDVDVSVFDVIANKEQSFQGLNMTIFYRWQLGTYPYYTSTGEAVYGGLPQNASLVTHLAHAFQDIKAVMPEPDFSGLAVIDWEAWRPRWAFNWDSKDIYRQRSMALVQAEHPDWPETLVESVAQDQFQEAAQAWMAGTLQLGQVLRPRGLWGYYGFPDCYNYDFLSSNYTGQCSLNIRDQNDQLEWLWNQSYALYPSIYLPPALMGTGKARLYVRHRVQEAFRVASASRDPSVPILPYVQIFYEMTDHLLSLEALEQSIGESTAQGAAGVVVWVSSKNTSTKESCQVIKEYMDSTLGPFIMNVTSAALLCSEALCSGHGRCARRPSYPEVLLTLNPASFSIQLTSDGRPPSLNGTLTLNDRTEMAMKFKCRCYRGWRGKWCEKQGFHLCGTTMQLGLTLVVGVALCLVYGQSLLQVPERPFSVLWNVPSARCKAHFGVHLPLSALSIVANYGQHFHGQNITIFYKNQFGLYPYFGPRGTVHNGGIPQAVSLNRHLAQAAHQILHSLGSSFAGLAVLDWEEWYPLWAGNWGPHRQVYQAASWAWAQQMFPQMGPQEQFHKAHTGFEQAARALMESTLQLGRTLCPRGLWGFYRYPVCGNGWHNTASNYTGHCHAATVSRNNQLHWLWAASSAIFPSIYLPPKMPPAYHQAFVQHRLEEAFRVALAGHAHPLPVLAYARLTHRSSGRFLSLDDLVRTIGVSAALGATGVVLWGDLSFSSSEEECWRLHDYLVGTLGPYVINVTKAAMACSHQRCHGHGRCARRDPGQMEAFLHLKPDGSLGAWKSFRCRCYLGWAGPTCQEPKPEPKEAT